MRPLRSLGIDVSARRGQDLVLLDGSGAVLEVRRHLALESLETAIRSLRPDVVAIDSPPGWGRSGGCRQAERALLRLGLHAFPTPSDPSRAEHPFFRWMTFGFRCFEEASRAGYPRYSRGSVRRTAIEVFPHASAAALSGTLPPRGVPKRAWREGVLTRLGVAAATLPSIDSIDAALCALTGLHALRGDFAAMGDPDEGLIVLPVPAGEGPKRFSAPASAGAPSRPSPRPGAGPRPWDGRRPPG